MQKNLKKILYMLFIISLSSCYFSDESQENAQSTTIVTGNDTTDTTMVIDNSTITLDDLSFEIQIDVIPNTYILSNIVTMSGLKGETSVSIENGLYSIDGDGFTSDIGTIRNGQSLQIKQATHVNSSSYSNSTITIGVESFVFTSITLSTFNNSVPVWGSVQIKSTKNIITDTAGGAKSLVAVDVDVDGDIDVLSASFSDDTVAWYENNGLGNFIKHVIADTADGATSVTTADVDGDGVLDVLSASSTDGTIAWYENDGSMGFTKHVITDDINGAVSVTTADVDSDGDLDVLSASNFEDRIEWYENDGAQGFTIHVITNTSNAASSVITADLDGDGDIDVLSASSLDNRIDWYENNGYQSFTTHTITNSADGAVSVTTGDLDSDGDLDVLSASNDDDTIAWYENDGEQGFTSHVISDTAKSAVSVATADVDGDGDLDVLSASWYDNNIDWYENVGSQGFIKHVIDNTRSNTARSVVAADMDGDGDLDVLSTSRFDNTIAWYDLNEAQYYLFQDRVNRTYSTFIATEKAIDKDGNILNYQILGGPDATLINIDSTTGDIHFNKAPHVDTPLDFNQDNNYEFIISVSDGLTSITKRIAILIHPGAEGDDEDNDGVDNVSDVFPLNPSEWVDTDDDKIGNNADLDDDNDGISDNEDPSPLDINDTQRAIWSVSVLVEPVFLISDTAHGATSVVTLDMDLDGDLDVLSASSHDDTIAWYESDGALGFSKHVISDTVNRVEFIESVDVNGDGNLDVVSLSGDGVSWFENDGSLVFTKHVITKYSFDRVVSVEIADVDGDDDIDAIFAFSDNVIAWYENDGVGNFIKHVITDGAGRVAGTDGTYSVKAGDVNGDGYLDVLSASSGDGTVVWFENNEVQTFTKHVISETARQASSVAIADVDGDGDIDVLATYGFDTITWYENNGAQVFTKNIITDNADADNVRSVSAVDIDDDGDLDVLLVSTGSESPITWYENMGKENFTKHEIVNTDNGIFSINGSFSLATADIDGDGDLELFSASYYDDSIKWYDLTEQTYQIAEGSLFATSVSATDVDNYPLSYQIMGGPDSDLFEINELTGDISFKLVPTYNSPLDYNSDNIYSLTIGANDSFTVNSSRIEIEILPAM